jgi:hypothetical protein
MYIFPKWSCLCFFLANCCLNAALSDHTVQSFIHTPPKRAGKKISRLRIGAVNILNYFYESKSALSITLQMLRKHYKTSLSTCTEWVNHKTIAYKMPINKLIKRYVIGIRKIRWNQQADEAIRHTNATSQANKDVFFLFLRNFPTNILSSRSGQYILR